jgi:hypothetical protein
VTLRRYAPIQPSAGTRWPPEVAAEIRERDGGVCVGARAGFPVVCVGKPVELDHVRASGGMGMKSRSTPDNGVCLDPWCHRWKTSNGREARPLLLEYLRRFYPDAQP